MSERKDLEIVMLSEEMAPLVLASNDTRYRVVSASDLPASPRLPTGGLPSPASSESEPPAQEPVPECEGTE
jgi:hypothetical protein